MEILKKIIIFLAVSFFLATSAEAQLFKKGLKIGYVDIVKIFDKYEKTDTSTEKLKKEIEEKRKEIEKKREDLNTIKHKLETQGTVISEQEKGKMEEEFEGKIKELKDITEKSNEELRQREQQFVKDIFEDIKEVIKIYGRDNGYDLILDSREILYGPEVMDISNDIVDIMNKKLKDKAR